MHPYIYGYPTYSENWIYPESDYHEIRKVLSKAYRRLPSERIEQVVQESLGEVAPENIENFLGTLTQIGQAALPIVGGAIGTAVGGPIGGALGAAGGQAAATAIGAATQPRPLSPPPAPPPRAAPPSVPPPRAASPSAPPPQPAPRATSAPRTRQPAPPRRSMSVPPSPPAQPVAPAATQLISLLLRPEFLQSLASLLFGSAGRNSVSVGGTPVPVSAFLNLLGVLADQAAAEHHSLSTSYSESVPEYLIESTGEFKCDITVPEQRAEVLWEMLQEEANFKSSGQGQGNFADWQTWQIMYDQMLDEYELAMAYTENEEY